MKYSGLVVAVRLLATRTDSPMSFGAPVEEADDRGSTAEGVVHVRDRRVVDEREVGGRQRHHRIGLTRLELRAQMCVIRVGVLRRPGSGADRPRIVDVAGGKVAPAVLRDRVRVGRDRGCQVREYIGGVPPLPPSPHRWLRTEVDHRRQRLRPSPSRVVKRTWGRRRGRLGFHAAVRGVGDRCRVGVGRSGVGCRVGRRGIRAGLEATVASASEPASAPEPLDLLASMHPPEELLRPCRPGR